MALDPPAPGPKTHARVVVLDTAALLAGLGPAQAGSSAKTRWLAPPQVVAEVRPGGPTGRALERAQSAGLEVQAADADTVAALEAVLRRLGEVDRLSGADRDVLALAWMLERAGSGPVAIWSDDYAVQNVARHLGIATEGVAQTGIRFSAVWHLRCTGCGRWLESGAPGDECPICGSPLKRTRKAPPAR